MHNQIDKLENKIGNKKFGRFLFNKYYNIRDLYWSIIYTIAFSVLAGIGNTFPELHSGFENVFNLFKQGFINNIYLAVIVNTFFTKIINSLRYQLYFRLIGNLFTVIVEIAFFIWHVIIGTENPLQTMTLIVILAFSLVNYHISALTKKIIAKYNNYTLFL